MALLADVTVRSPTFGAHPIRRIRRGVAPSWQYLVTTTNLVTNTILELPLLQSNLGG